MSRAFVIFFLTRTVYLLPPLHTQFDERTIYQHHPKNLIERLFL